MSEETGDAVMLKSIADYKEVNRLFGCPPDWSSLTCVSYMCEDTIQRILAISRSASAGRTLRKLLNEPIVDALRSEWETISDDLQRIASEYDLATSPSGDSGE